MATDHGFFLAVQAEAGDVCAKPQGNWIKVRERSLLGDGAADKHSFVVAAARVGIRGDFAQFAGPRAMAPYHASLLYFHSRVSLRGCGARAYSPFGVNDATGRQASHGNATV